MTDTRAVHSRNLEEAFPQSGRKNSESPSQGGSLCSYRCAMVSCVALGVIAITGYFFVRSFGCKEGKATSGPWSGTFC